eukprot:CAMPEP_0177659454 /NCGR_PEP_ID=MMETSP0447-20121125/17451_1 /TAXON_ID=0 /ORGANISM="Stygamoeba regulata, Strain BSH-02190019" /LENGTH=165 /DNA_ID=CAMNT_0019164325 /DNA_START=64 /DNA_END=558 /DNA_ORIENTATION=+
MLWQAVRACAPTSSYQANILLACLVPFVVLVIASLFEYRAGSVVLAGTPRVVDGDTIVLAGERVRLAGIDAPEAAQKCISSAGDVYACGAASTDKLTELTANGVRCECDTERDQYSRLLCECFATHDSKKSVNARMVRAGMAVAYISQRFAPDQAHARALRRGVW